MDGESRNPGAGKPGKARRDKAGRLAEALRDNLRKRKAQLRARARRDDTGRAGNRPQIDPDNSEKS